MPKMTERTSIIENGVITEGVRRLRLAAPKIARIVQPGQFVHLRVSDTLDPLLRRPLSVAGADAAKGTIDIVYRIVGRGTEHLATRRPGDELDCMGPLGNTFGINADQPKKPLLVGGGMGLAPLLYLAAELCPRPVAVWMGGRSSAEMFWAPLFTPLCENLKIRTDDGSMGEQGFAADGIEAVLTAGHYDKIFTCGPKPMIRVVAIAALKANIPCEISLEDYMACGVGACLSCVCEASSGGHRKICVDGPIFQAGEVVV